MVVTPGQSILVRGRLRWQSREQLRAGLGRPTESLKIMARSNRGGSPRPGQRFSVFNPPALARGMAVESGRVAIQYPDQAGNHCRLCGASSSTTFGVQCLPFSKSQRKFRIFTLPWSKPQELWQTHPAEGLCAVPPEASKDFFRMGAC